MIGAGARYSASARLDRLPIGSFHKRAMWALAYVFFFELGDLNSFAFAAPALRVQWKLSVPTIGIITSAAFIGMFVGAVTGGWFSDRVGRKKALLLTTSWYSVFSLLNAFAWNVPSLFALRFLTGVGLSAMTAVAITYISEVFPAKKRGTYQAWIMTIGLFGIAITAFVAGEFIRMAPYGWRLVFVWGALGIAILLFSRHLEESPRWHENHGRLAEADAVLDRIEARSGIRRQLRQLHASAQPIFRSVRPRISGANFHADGRLDFPDAGCVRISGVGSDAAGGARIPLGGIATLGFHHGVWRTHRRAACRPRIRPMGA